MYNHLKIEEKGNIAIMTISAPKSLNALNTTILNEIDEFLDEFEGGQFRCLIITGDGEKSFVAGADIILSPQIYVAIGYNFRRASEMKIVSNDEERGSSHGAGLSLGGGVQLDRFKLNVAYGKYHVSSHSLLVNVSYSL